MSELAQDFSVEIQDVKVETDIDSQVLAIPEQARLIVVKDKESMTMADNTINGINEWLKKVDEHYKPMADAAFKTHRSITSRWKEIKQPLEDAKTHLVNLVKAYQRKVREEAEAEQRRLAEIARKQEEERRLAEAIEAEKEGNVEEAQAIIEEEVFVPTPVVRPDVPKVDGRRYATKPKARVINKMDVIKVVASNPTLIDLLDINVTVANQKAKAFGTNLGKIIKGLEYYED
jgi:hypothetical protein